MCLRPANHATTFGLSAPTCHLVQRFEAKMDALFSRESLYRRVAAARLQEKPEVAGCNQGPCILKCRFRMPCLASVGLHVSDLPDSIQR